MKYFDISLNLCPQREAHAHTHGWLVSPSRCLAGEDTEMTDSLGWKEPGGRAVQKFETKGPLEGIQGVHEYGWEKNYIFVFINL